LLYLLALSLLITNSPFLFSNLSRNTSTTSPSSTIPSLLNSAISTNPTDFAPISTATPLSEMPTITPFTTVPSTSFWLSFSYSSKSSGKFSRANNFYCSAAKIAALAALFVGFAASGFVLLIGKLIK